MLQELIEKTNTVEFYSHWDLKPMSIDGNIEDFTSNELSLKLGLSTQYPEKKEEVWLIKASQVSNFRNLFQPIYLPFSKLVLLDEHPLLWSYQYDNLLCELKWKGDRSKFDEFIGKLHWLYEKHTGGFIKWNRDFHGIQQLREKEEPVTISVNSKTLDFLEGLLDEYGLEVVSSSKETGQKSSSRPKKILLFGNEDVAPNDYDLLQPYLIGESFEASKIL